MGVITNLLVGLGLDPAGMSDGLDEAGGMLEKAKKTFAVAGAAIGAGLVAGVVGEMNIDAANDKLAAQLGLTAGQSKAAGEAGGNLFAGAYGESLEEVNDAVGAVMSSIAGMRDASSADIEAVTAKALDFAAAFETEVGRSSQVAGQLIRTGLAKDATEAFDLLTAASQRVPANIREDVIDAADEYGQFFAGIGMTGEQAFATLVDASAKGMFGIDKIGDAVKEFTIRSTDMSTASQEAYAAIGLDAQDMANKMLAGGDQAAGATQQVVAGLLSMTDPSEQAAAAIALFGTPLEDLNVKDIPAFLQSLQGGSDAMAGFAGSSEAMGDTLADNAATNLTSFKRQVQTAFVDFVGGRALPIVNTMAKLLATKFGPALDKTGDVLEVAGRRAKQFAGWVEDNKTPITIVGSLIAAVFIPHLIALGIQSVIAGAKAVAGWVMTQAAAIAAAATHSAAVVAMVAGWVLAGAQALLGAAKVAAAWLIAMGPAALVVAAVVGLGVLIYKNWDKIKVWTAAAWDWVVGKLKWALDTAVSMFLNFTLVGLVIKHWDTIKSATSTAWNAVTGFVKSIPGKLVSFFLNWTLPGLFIQHWQTLKNGAITKATELVTWVGGLPGMLLGGLGDLGGLLVDAGGDVVRGLWDGIRGMKDWIIGKLKDFVKDAIPGPIKAALDIHSPSRVAAAIGRQVPAGLVVGIMSGVGVVASAAARMADAAVPEVESPTFTASYAAPTPTVAGVEAYAREAANPAAGSSSGFDYEHLARLIGLAVARAVAGIRQELVVNANGELLARLWVLARLAAETHTEEVVPA